MQAVFNSSRKKYEDVINKIILDNELDQIDFPLIIENMQIDGLKEFLSEELYNKIGFKDKKKQEVEEEKTQANTE